MRLGEVKPVEAGISTEGAESVARYLSAVDRTLETLPRDQRQTAREKVEAHLELEFELAHAVTPEERDAVLTRLPPPEEAARRYAGFEPLEEKAGTNLTPCRDCGARVSVQAEDCPACGAPAPAFKEQASAQLPAAGASGYEYKSDTQILGMPLVHVAYGRDARGQIRRARGFFALGQFASGYFVVAQFGAARIFGLGQFIAAPIAIAQFAFGLLAIGQFGIGLLLGIGMIATGLKAIGGLTLPFIR